MGAKSKARVARRGVPQQLQRALLAILAVAGCALTVWVLQSTTAAPWWTTQRGNLRQASDTQSYTAVEDAVVHLVVLQRGCTELKESMITWQYGLEEAPVKEVNDTDPNALDAIRDCPDVDIYIPGSLRSFGYCEDAAAYAKFLKSRMLPRWVLERTWLDPKTQKQVSYHELCPHTPLIFFNHYWEKVNESPRWPASKKIFLMPNIEMYELQSEHYWKSDVVMCKTRICYEYATKWFKDNGNPKNTKVLFTRFTSSDLAGTAMRVLGQQAIRRKDFASPVFVHTPGHSIQKGTKKIIDCWLRRPDYPPVDIHMTQDLFISNFNSYGDRIEASPNIRLHIGVHDSLSFGKLLAGASFFLCTSLMEGYGHYLNQARAAGGLVVTVDVPPMNELVTNTSGLVMPADRWADSRQFLGGKDKREHALRGVEGFTARFGADGVCRAVDYILEELTPDDRQRRAERSRAQYLEETQEFADQMDRLRAIARDEE